MGKQNVVYACDRVLFSLKKEGDSDISYNMDELEDIMLSEISQPQKDKCCMIPLTWLSRVVRFIETESRIEVTGSWGEGGEWGVHV